MGSGALAAHYRDASVIDLEISVTCLMSGEPCMFSFFRDITERVRLERQIMEVSDRVQANFGSEIHDGLCQTLVTAAFDANSLNRRLAATTPLDAPTLGRLCRLLAPKQANYRSKARKSFLWQGASSNKGSSADLFCPAAIPASTPCRLLGLADWIRPGFPGA